MGGARALLDEHADGGLRARRAARRRGDHDPRPLPIASPASPRVTVFVGRGCHLCEAALEVVEQVRADVPLVLDVVEIDGDPALEARYRESLPVVEVDGERAFTWFVEPDALRERLSRPAPNGAGSM